MTSLPAPTSIQWESIIAGQGFTSLIAGLWHAVLVGWQDRSPAQWARFTWQALKGFGAAEPLVILWAVGWIIAEATTTLPSGWVPAVSFVITLIGRQLVMSPASRRNLEEVAVAHENQEAEPVYLMPEDN